MLLLPVGGRRQQPCNYGWLMARTLNCCGPQAGNFPLHASVFSPVNQILALWEECKDHQRKVTFTGDLPQGQLQVLNVD